MEGFQRSPCIRAPYLCCKSDTKSILRVKKKMRITLRHRDRQEGPQRSTRSDLKRVVEQSRNCLRAWPEMWTTCWMRLRASKLADVLTLSGALRRSQEEKLAELKNLDEHRLRPMEKSSEDRWLFSYGEVWGLLKEQCVLFTGSRGLWKVAH